MPVTRASNGDVLVIVNVRLFDAGLKVRFTVAVAELPVEFPTIVNVDPLAGIVSAKIT
jgi:hypothetical protein